LQRRRYLNRLNRQRRRPNNNLVSRVLSGPVGTQKFQVDLSLSITPNSQGIWGLQINPGSFIQNSVYGGLLAIYTKMRVKSYKIRVSYPASSTGTAGEYKTWLARDTTSQTALTYPVLSGQHGVRTNKLYERVDWNWHPIETKDYDFENINAVNDDGILYGGVSVVTTGVTPVVQVRMIVHMYAATFQSKAIVGIADELGYVHLN